MAQVVQHWPSKLKALNSNPVLTKKKKRERETPLNIDFGTKNERQGCKIGTVCMGSTYGRGRGNGGDEGEGIWLMGFIYIYEIK
jgi:hypothetical protein